MDIVQGMQVKDRRALARAISLVENGAPRREELVIAAFCHGHKAPIIGVTGAPGVGKSTLVDGLAACFRAGGQTVGIIAVDPTSPFTGGAILGDRVRMQRHGQDPGVFIRSLATRGHLGGLSRATGEVIRLMDWFGFDLIIVETVGAGQSEVDIMGFATTVLVVTVPGLGDDVQAIKAGIMEIGDVFCVNKADREGVARAVMEIEMMLDHKPPGDWRPPVVQTVASTGQGIPELARHLEEHGSHLESSGEISQRRARTFCAEVGEVLKEHLVDHVLECARVAGDLEALAAQPTDPFSAARCLVEKYGGASSRFSRKG